MRRSEAFSHLNLFVFGLTIIVCAAWFNVGYHHPDEHFQILEPAAFKLGKGSEVDLPWELHERIRPGLQPLMAYGMVRALDVTGLYDPFWQAFILRLISGVAAFSLYYQFSKRHIITFSRQESTRWLVIAICFLWFVPYVSSRFSSENWGAISFFLGVLILLRQNSKAFHLTIAGLLFGLSFWFRFQMGFALTGLAAWLLFVRKMPFSGLLWLALGGLTAMFIGIYADFWLYGEFVITPINYFIANITYNRAAEWGVAPWWYYFSEYLISAAPPLSVALALLAVPGFWALRKNVLAWVFVPFCLVHMAVGHKELRFLFPMVLPYLVFVVNGAGIFVDKFALKRWHRLVLGLCLVVNTGLLTFRIFAPAHDAVLYLRFLHKYARDNNKPVLLVSEKDDPFVQVGMCMNFYKPKNINTLILKDLEFTESEITGSSPKEFLVFHQKAGLDLQVRGYKKTRLYSLFPDWFSHINFNNWLERSNISSVWLFKRE